MKTRDVDLFVIGAGSGGVRASRMAADAGARVAVAEERYLGGTCVNVGCIPKKLMVYASHFSEDLDHAAGFGWDIGDRSHHWHLFCDRKDREIHRLNTVYARLLDEAGVQRMEGHARILDPHTVAVGATRVSANQILIATGSWPSIPPIPGVEHAITSNEVFALPELPERVLILGGGYIAVEFAGIFSGLGAHTTVVHRGERVLRGFDDDLRSTLTDELGKKGIALRLGTTIEHIEEIDTGIRAHLSDGTTADAGLLLCATGRTPLTENLGLETTSIRLADDGSIPVDAFSRTAEPSVYAIGDVTNRLNLTPMAIAEAMALVKTLFGDRPVQPDYTFVPTAVFSRPPIATVGLTEEQARNQYERVDVYRTTFRPLKHTLSGSEEKTMMKLLVDAGSDRVLGVHMVGADAGEMIQGFAVALRCGATKAEFDATVGVHPTSAEEFVTLRDTVSS